MATIAQIQANRLNVILLGESEISAA